MQAFPSEGSDDRHCLEGESSSRVAGLRQQAGRAQSKSRGERQVVRHHVRNLSVLLQHAGLRS